MSSPNISPPTSPDGAPSSQADPPLTELVDDTLEAYIAWLEERAGVWAGYQGWSDAPADDRSLAFSAYQAALDREEKASCVYAELLAALEQTLMNAPVVTDADIQAAL